MIIIMGDGRKFSHIACRWIGYYGVSATACFQRGKLRLFPFLHLSPFTTASHINSVNFHLFRSQQLPNGTNPLYRSTSHRCYTRPRNSDADDSKDNWRHLWRIVGCSYYKKSSSGLKRNSLDNTGSQQLGRFACILPCRCQGGSTTFSRPAPRTRKTE